MADGQPTPSPTRTDAEGAFPPEAPYYRYLGLVVTERAAGRSVVRLPHRPELTNSRGEIHGGVQGSLLDIALSQALRSVLPPGSKVERHFGPVQPLAVRHVLRPSADGSHLCSFL